MLLLPLYLESQMIEIDTVVFHINKYSKELLNCLFIKNSDKLTKYFSWTIIKKLQNGNKILATRPTTWSKMLETTNNEARHLNFMWKNKSSIPWLQKSMPGTRPSTQIVSFSTDVEIPPLTLLSSPSHLDPDMKQDISWLIYSHKSFNCQNPTRNPEWKWYLTFFILFIDQFFARITWDLRVVNWRVTALILLNLWEYIRAWKRNVQSTTPKNRIGPSMSEMVQDCPTK